MKQRILLIDGGMGTLIQDYKLEEQVIVVNAFADWHSDLRVTMTFGTYTYNWLIKDIHLQYLEAGAEHP
ncbi:homocysteine S-methyltransferase family protein [Vibrio chagasii]|nr:homocysteine S-methyltransferase family protein [Vibrio chagasii]